MKKLALLASKMKKVFAGASAFMLAAALVFTAGSVVPAAAANPAGQQATSQNGQNNNNESEGLGGLSSKLMGDADTDKVENVAGNMVGVIAILARVVGVIIGAFGLFKTVLAMKDQDSNGITTGVILVAVAAVLLFLPTIISAVFGIDASLGD